MGAPTQEIIESRLKYIETVMRAQRASGNPRKWIVLEAHRRIRAWDRDYELQLPAVPFPCPKGTALWIMRGFDLVKVIVASDASADKLWCHDEDHTVEFLVERSDVHVTPIPLRPLAIRARDLYKFLGTKLAAEWHQLRARRDR